MIVIKLNNPLDLDTIKEMLFKACSDSDISNETRKEYISVTKQALGCEIDYEIPSICEIVDQE